MEMILALFHSLAAQNFLNFHFKGISDSKLQLHCELKTRLICWSALHLIFSAVCLFVYVSISFLKYKYAIDTQLWREMGKVYAKRDRSICTFKFGAPYFPQCKLFFLLSIGQWFMLIKIPGFLQEKDMNNDILEGLRPKNKEVKARNNKDLI